MFKRSTPVHPTPTRSACNKKPYCKVCHDAGKPQSDYSSHYVRSLPDQQGNTTILCPTLLNTECRFCYGLGHTAKFCPLALKKSEERENRGAKQVQPQVQPQVQKSQVQKSQVQKSQVQFRGGGFSALRDLEDDNAVNAVPLSNAKNAWPTLGAPSQRVSNVPSYASAAAKQVPEAEAVKVLPFGFQVLQKGAVYARDSEKPRYPARVKWADYDSEED